MRWPVNRSVISQSNFFHTLFNGSFKESKLKEVEIKTNDGLINETSFKKLLDVLYSREINVGFDDIFNLIVTAQYFQMDEVVDFCESKIEEMIKSSNAVEIYEFSDRYFLMKTKERVFQWMLLRLFPVKSWDEMKCVPLELVENLIAHPRLVTQNEMYLYFLLKMMIQIEMNGTCRQDNESFYKKIRRNQIAFLSTKEGTKFRKAFQALRLGNILVRKENVEMILADNIIPRCLVDKWIFKNWMSMICIESPENFGPTSDVVTKEEFETHAMRFSKVIHGPDYHSWKFIGFSYAFDLALFFDGRTLIIKRVHQINEHKISHSHLLRRIMLRWDIAEMNSSDVIKRQEDIQTFTMSTNEEICLKQLRKEPKYPCRVSVEVLFHIPYRVTESNKINNFMFENEHIGHEDQNTGSSIRTSIKARAFKSYKKFFNLPS
jgi:BTB/POZ domain